MVAPTSLWFELASICLKKIKAHPGQKEVLLQALILAGRLPIQPIEVDQPEVVQLAWQTGLTTYDAGYLWLVQRLRGDLVTMDENLKRKIPFRSVVNEDLRSGLSIVEAPGKQKKYRTTPRPMGLRPGRNLDNIQELLVQVEGENRR
jgi:predicted nucleic acid-binding protein